ncbi:MAG: Stk1 family PASTA domain-containing Ser/Thr kinase [Lachnospiraceae bacterium]|nr:Stk1 family PASTA domain-containing Ser/Thr kinase [Lachnospiraceae bacterium]
MIKIGMMIGDRYEILDKIGTGGMSDVYKGKDHKLNRYVAVKVLKQEFSENANFVSKFRIEAQAAAGLMHPNIVNVYDVGEEDGMYYIVMELVEGITLKNYIEKKARLSVKEAISIAIQVSMGIEAAHNNHIIHRDIKPQNIIISKEGKVKVTDFGIAKAATSNTITSNVMGSVHYTSPEQARGGFSDEKSDIYSLGCTMFEMLTGRVPFDGETTVTVAIKHIQEDMPSPREFVPEIPVSVEQIIFKATQKSPDRRYQSMGELIVDLKHSLISPDEDFVKMASVDANAATKLISEEDIAQIKDRTSNISLTEEVVKPRERDVEMPDISRTEKERKKEVRRKPVEDDEEDDDLDPKMEKVTAILAIVAAVIILLIVLALLSRALGLFRGGSSGNNTENTETQNIENVTETEQNDSDELVTMINVVGKNIDEVKQTLNSMNLGTRVTTEESDTYDVDIVISQAVAEGQTVEKYTTIDLVVSSGIKGYDVPNVEGSKVDDAVAVLENQGFVVAKDYANSDSVEKDVVISQSPTPSSKSPKGATVTIVISQGAEIKKVSVPDLRGMTESAAKAKLEENHLKCGEIKEDYSDTTTKGCVITQTQTPGMSVDEGTSVGITLSRGKKVVTYKYVANLSAPTGYTDGTVTITITASNGDIRSFTTSSFPCAVNETGFQVSDGTIIYTYKTKSTQTEVDPDTGEETVVETEGTVTTSPQSITFEAEN